MSIGKRVYLGSRQTRSHGVPHTPERPRSYAVLALAVLLGGAGCFHRGPQAPPCENIVTVEMPPVRRVAELSPRELFAGGAERYVVFVQPLRDGVMRAYGVDTGAARVAWVLEDRAEVFDRVMSPWRLPGDVQGAPVPGESSGTGQQMPIEEPPSAPGGGQVPLVPLSCDPEKQPCLLGSQVGGRGEGPTPSGWELLVRAAQIQQALNMRIRPPTYSKPSASAPSR